MHIRTCNSCEQIYSLKFKRNGITQLLLSLKCFEHDFYVFLLENFVLCIIPNKW